MKNPRLITISLVLSIFLVVLIPVSIKARPQITNISVWFTENDTEKPGVLDLVNQVNMSNPDIHVDALQKGFFDARALYTNAFIAANEPEVFRAARDWVPEFAVAGMIAPLTAEYTTEDLNDFLPSAIRLVTYPDSEGIDQIWGFPQLIDTPALMYNKEIMINAGIDVPSLNINTSWTWDQFIGNASFVVDNTTAYGYTIAGMFFGAQAIFFGQGARLFNDGILDINHIAINSTESRSALTFLKNMIDVEQITPVWEEMGWETINVLFADDGEVAMIQQGPWELKNFLDNSPEFNPTVDGAKPYASADNLGIMQLPHDEAGNQGAPLGGHAYIISAFASGDKYDAAVKLSKFLSGEDAMAAGAIDYYHVPARESVMERSDVKSSAGYEYVLGFKKNVDKAFQVPVDHRWARIEQEFADNIDEYLADDISLDECIAQTISIWKEVLGQAAIDVNTTTTVTDGTQTDTTTTTSTELTEETPGFRIAFFLLSFPIIIWFTKKRRQ
ncbi:MAG: extracellular solute-binding protein [Candidatus Kariarchaeaceae archaeon]|jgi:arabinogalactan oligomer/maltooligosaccharide transport system substrate-binding protein